MVSINNTALNHAVIALTEEIGRVLDNDEHVIGDFKRGSKHAAHTAKALRWRVDQLTKMPHKENSSLLVMVYFMSRSDLGFF